MTVTELRLWTVEEYHRMIETNILTTGDRVELLQGQIIQMSPQKPPHAATTQCVSDRLRDLLTGKATIRVQLPISLPPNSEPEPDIAVVRSDSRQYFDRHPNSDDIFLLIEVADATLTRDRQQKARIYAQANVSEYWVVDVSDRRFFVLRDPGEKNYQQELILDENATISLLAFPEVTVAIVDLFP